MLKYQDSQKIGAVSPAKPMLQRVNQDWRQPSPRGGDARISNTLAWSKIWVFPILSISCLFSAYARIAKGNFATSTVLLAVVFGLIYLKALKPKSK